MNRGVAYAEGKVFLQRADSTLEALDANTGKVVWPVKNGDPTLGAVNTNAPHVFKNKVITGISGGEWGVRGFVAAYDINTGKQVWKGYSVGPDAEMLIDPATTTTWADGKVTPVGADSSLKTWEGDQWTIGGGTTSGWYSYDQELNLLYYGTGNPSTWNSSNRPGDNKWASSILARDLDTGFIKWAYQTTPHDEWGYGADSEMILSEMIIQGGAKRTLVHFDRNGFAFTLDRKNGALLVAEKYDPQVNWATQIDIKTGRPQVVSKYSTAYKGSDADTNGVCPAAVGSKNQQPASVDPRTGLFYVPTNHVCMDYQPFKVEYTAGVPYVGHTLSMYPAPNSHGGTGNFIAWDAGQGKIVWSKPEKFSVDSGALTTAGDVAFYGTLEGYLKAVSVKDGRELWKFKTPSGIIGNVFTYEHQGRQYVGVFSGIGGWAGIAMAAGLEKDQDGLGAVGGYRELTKSTDLGGSLTVFALPETISAATNPPHEPDKFATVRVLFATDRKVNNTGQSRISFGADRSTLSYGVCDVTIPRDHRMGELEAPSVLRLWREDPAKDVVLLGTHVQSKDKFFKELADRVRKSPKSNAFLFIHGYNVSFKDAARRTAQISYDLGFDGAPVFYSWPSQGKPTPTAYIVDEQNIEWTQLDLARFLNDFFEKSTAKNIYLMALLPIKWV